MKYFDYNEINNIMTNIIAEGEKSVWLDLEKEPNALKRHERRLLFYQAIKKLAKGK